MEINSLIKIIDKKLKENFVINNLKIEDKSYLHKKHKNFNKDKFHIKLTIGSPAFNQMDSIEVNRKIYNILKDEMRKSIHSLQIIIV